MTDSEIKEKISITYLPPPLGSLQTEWLKADDRPGSPLKGALGGVQGVRERKGKSEPPSLAQLEPPNVEQLLQRVSIRLPSLITFLGLIRAA